jgi:hypothetical protein
MATDSNPALMTPTVNAISLLSRGCLLARSAQILMANSPINAGGSILRQQTATRNVQLILLFVR